MGCRPSGSGQNITRNVSIPDKRNRNNAVDNKAQSVEELKITGKQFVEFKSSNLHENYRIGKRIGDGAFATVTLGLHKITGLQRAIKTIKKKSLERNIGDRDRFYSEIAILKTMDHPNIIKIYEVYEDDKHIHLVTELCTGGELFDYILEKKRFSEKIAAHFLKQLFQAIVYCHHKGIVHRDLKPENLLLEKHANTANLKVIDFGTSALIDPNKKLKQKLGTPYYTAPEIIKSKYNEKVDVWSWGVVMYILLCGYPPFNGNTDEQILAKVVKGQFDYPDQEWSQISPSAKDLINSMLTTDPNKRISMQQALEHEWMISMKPEPTELDEGSVSFLQNLQSFRADEKLAQAVLSFIASQLVNQEDTNDLKETFKALDTNGDGMLSREELVAGYTKMLGSPELAMEEVDVIMKRVDTDGSGFIDYTEFVAATMNKKKLVNKANLETVFKAFDKDGSGSISTDELKTMLGGENMRDDLWIELIGEVDEDKNGEVDLVEFTNMMLKKF